MAAKTKMKLPSFDQLMNPLLRALQALGGSGSIEEIYDKVVELERFPDDLLLQLRPGEKQSDRNRISAGMGAQLSEKIWASG